VGQGDEGDHAPLELVERNYLRPGDFYVLMPPEGDIHSVATTSPNASVSIHLLGNDTGCVWRHAYTPDEGSIRAFRSGWSNVPCRD
jgi:3-mercaptopropionate dioxygenase